MTLEHQPYYLRVTGLEYRAVSQGYFVLASKCFRSGPRYPVWAYKLLSITFHTAKYTLSALANDTDILDLAYLA